MFDLFRKRRSIRKFQEKPVEPEKVELLKEALLRTPSSHNYRAWEFIFVDDPVLLEKLSKVRGGSSAFLEGAPLGIVILGNEETANVWVEDAAAAAMSAQLAATALELGSCWIQIRLRDHSPEESAEEYVKKILNIPEPYRVDCIIAVGYPAEEKAPYSKEELPWDKIHENGF